MNVMTELTRVNRILKDKEYQAYIRETEELEKDRIYCRHNMEHFLAVARIACILNIDEGSGIDRELIYAAALLHDIGRGHEYISGVRHEEESTRLAPSIIQRAGFDEDEEKIIISAIATHRDKECVKDIGSLNSLIYRADKLSRTCYHCDAYDKCNKAPGKRNDEIRV